MHTHLISCARHFLILPALFFFSSSFLFIFFFLLSHSLFSSSFVSLDSEPDLRVVMFTSHALYEFKVDPMHATDALLPQVPPTTLSLSGRPQPNEFLALPPYSSAAESIHHSRLKKRKEWLSIQSIEGDTSEGSHPHLKPNKKTKESKIKLHSYLCCLSL